MANPTEKRTLQDYWKVPFRGLVPGGLNDQKGSPSLPKITEPDDAPLVEETDDASISCNIPDVEPAAIPINIIDDLSHIIGTVRKSFYAFQVQVGAIETVRLLGQDTARRRAVIKNLGPGSIFIGATESIGRTGYALAVNTIDPPLEVITTEEMWILQETGQSSNAVVHVFMEFDKQK